MRITVAVVFVILLTVSATGQQHNTLALGGVRNSTGPRRFNERQLQTLQESLRHKTGLVELGFDEQGVLTLGNRQHIAGGSATARALLIAAVDSRNLYELESHERSPEIAFARLVESENRKRSGTDQRTTIYCVQLDSADFNHLQGAGKAKASFDIGIVLLHELVHGVLQLQDPNGAMDQIGECDAHVNQIRRELQLPERLYYHPSLSVIRSSDGRRIVFAKLEFVERPASNALPSAKYWLTWSATLVSPNARNIAGLQEGVLMTSKR